MKLLPTLCLLFIVASWTVVQCSAQKNNSDSLRPKKLFFTTGVNVNYLSNHPQYLGEVGILYGVREYAHGGGAVYGMRYTAECTRLNGSTVIGLKAGYEAALIFFMLRGSTVVYSDFHRYNLSIVPEIGLSFFGSAHISYGFVLPLVGAHILEPSSRLCITLNWL